MTVLTDIIDIQISRETTAVSRAAFNIPMFLATHANFTERSRSYSSLQALSADFDSESDVYAAASKLFGQEIRPPQIVIGKRYADSVDVSLDSVSGNAVLTYEGQEVTTDISGAVDATAAVALVKTDFDSAGISTITFTDNLDGTFSIAPASAGDQYSFTYSSQFSATYNATETWVEALDAVSNENNEWYALTAGTHTEADILALAGAVEARKKIYGTSSSDAEILNASSTNDIATQLFDLGYQRTFIVYSANADTQYPEAAWIGGQLPEQPGSNTWKFKSLAGVTVSALNSTQANAAKDKNANTYERVGGVSIVSEGTMAGGEFIDVIIFVDWLEARMRESIFFRLVNTKKIPYTQAGVTIIENEIRRVLAEGITNGGLAPNPQPTVSVPNVLALDPNLRATRTLEGISFEGRLAGAIHFVKVRGTVTV
ncbi:MAG: hypothetical protein GOVbin1096_71 [Prokaryotic dsDNA virus sp.]|jgi:hypothetical protein|nr:MAG: hypothetical protein GOVbin1096_71 [Prokaryotic dsDNA virus sp.]|tara:strand:- start:2354 stop:3643 length:1290 start_codon:yes stop_codon:yes gene_type:complete